MKAEAVIREAAAACELARTYQCTISIHMNPTIGTSLALQITPAGIAQFDPVPPTTLYDQDAVDGQ